MRKKALVMKGETPGDRFCHLFCRRCYICAAVLSMIWVAVLLLAWID